MRRAILGVLVLALVGCSSRTVASDAAESRRDPVSGIDLRMLDPSVRPQDDFYLHANGGWLRRTTIPENAAAFDLMMEMERRMERDLLAMLDEAADPGRAHDPLSDWGKVGAFYRSFLDTTRVEMLGLGAVEAELRAIAAIEHARGLPGLMGRLLRSGVPTPLTLWVAPDRQRTERHAVYVSQAGLGLSSRQDYLGADSAARGNRDSYERHVARLLALAGEPRASAMAAEVLALETRLAGLQWDPARLRDDRATYNPHRLAELRSAAPAVEELVRAAGMQDAPVVVVMQPDYAAALEGALSDVALPVWKAYLTVRLLSAYGPYLHRPVRDARLELRRALTGQQGETPRRQAAIGVINSQLGWVFGRLYVERHFPPETERRVRSLVENVVAAFDERLDSLSWMTPATRAEARRKLANLAVEIGHPRTWPSHEGLVIDDGDLAGNVRRARHHAFDQGARLLDQPVDRLRWTMLPQQVNAQVSLVNVTMFFPAGILQPPYFDPQADDAANYGAIGVVIAHEIVHSFDDQGRHYDAAGNLRDWWSPEDARRFGDLASAVAAQASQFEALPGLYLNGRLTLGENLADLGGIRAAYIAYQRSLEGRQAPVIDGLTGDQRFFLAWAQLWRRLETDALLRERVLHIPHPPHRYRAVGPVRNMAEFHRAFGVRPGDAMYLPVESRVEVW